VRAVRVDFGADQPSARQEWFLAGTETAAVRPKAASGSLPRIAYPATGAVIALDPDIPQTRQRVAFRMRPPGGDYRWRLNGRDLPTRDGLALWAPQPGRHRLDLVDARGKFVDQAEFEVRGASQLARQ
jgi:penicillin-binding protein 1C